MGLRRMLSVSVMLESSSSDEGGQIPRGHGHRASRPRRGGQLTHCSSGVAVEKCNVPPEVISSNNTSY